MTLRLILESAPQPQMRTEFRLADGQVVIGRGEDCDWKFEDPQMFVSRRHCVIVGRGGDYQVTDESRGGLFLDGAQAPLGQGVSAPLRPGMRLRLGDFVIRAEVESAAAAAPQSAAAKPAMFGDDFFTPRPEAPPPPRPASLPDPFDTPRMTAAAAPEPPARPAPPAFFDDPFTMDHGPSRAVPNPVPAAPPASAPAGDFDFGDFGLPANLAPPRPAPAPVAAPPAAPPPLPPEPLEFDLPPRSWPRPRRHHLRLPCPRPSLPCPRRPRRLRPSMRRRRSRPMPRRWPP